MFFTALFNINNILYVGIRYMKCYQRNLKEILLLFLEFSFSFFFFKFNCGMEMENFQHVCSCLNFIRCLFRMYDENCRFDSFEFHSQFIDYVHISTIYVWIMKRSLYMLNSYATFVLCCCCRLLFFLSLVIHL
jgi:hypothetical protein